VFYFELREFISHFNARCWRSFFLSFLFCILLIRNMTIYNMLVLMLDFKYKSMWLVNAYLGCEITATLGVQYNEHLLLLLLLEVHKLLMFNGVQNIVKESLDNSIIVIILI